MTEEAISSLTSENEIGGCVWRVGEVGRSNFPQILSCCIVFQPFDILCGGSVDVSGGVRFVVLENVKSTSV